jgi:cytidylate kinase
MNEVIAIDGTSASGKSACAEVAKRLGYALLETGAIYRTIALMVLRAKIDPTNTTDVERFVRSNFDRITFHRDQLCFDNQPVGDEIRTPEVSSLTPVIAKQLAVRKMIAPLQRNFNGGEALVAEGRDIGSVIFPDARVKVFLTADLKVRAERRLKQHLEMDSAYVGTLEEEMARLDARDKEDMNRPDSPLIRLPEAVFIDSTFMTKDEVIKRILRACQE